VWRPLFLWSDKVESSMERRERILTGTLQIVVVVCILLTLGSGEWLGLGYIAEVITGVMALLLGVFLSAYCFTLLRQFRKQGRCVSRSDKVHLYISLLTGLMPLAFLIWVWVLVERFK